MNSVQKYQTFGKRFLAGLIDAIVFIPFHLIDSRLENTSDKDLFIGWTLFHTACWLTYVIIAHGKYGQTVGKKLMGIKVFSIDEKNVIGYKKAFLRESIWVFAILAGIADLAFGLSNTSTVPGNTIGTSYNDFVGLVSIIWLVLELVTMFFNNKRRALHDFIAGSVVIDLHELNRENLQKRQQELITSLEQK